MTTIFFSPEAENQLNDLLAYLETEWGIAVRVTASPGTVLPKYLSTPPGTALHRRH
jgi:hypothetical protein